MKVSEIRRQFLRLAYERDIRKPPDNRRRGQFRAGWFGTVSEETLKQKLTWHNLGYRMGQHFGSQSDEQIDEVFQILADDYPSGATPPAKKAISKAAKKAGPQRQRGAGRKPASRRSGVRGGAGEGDAHRTLKEYIRDNPLSVGVNLKRAKVETEKDLPSGDRIDVFFENRTFWTGVEVKSEQSSEDDVRRGLYQCVKYRAVMEADCAVRGIKRNIQVLLALGGPFPQSLRREKTVLDIAVIDEITGPS